MSRAPKAKEPISEEVVLGGVIFSTPDFGELTDILSPYCAQEERDVVGPMYDDRACWYFDRATNEVVIRIPKNSKIFRYQLKDLTLTGYGRKKILSTVSRRTLR